MNEQIDALKTRLNEKDDLISTQRWVISILLTLLGLSFGWSVHTLVVSKQIAEDSIRIETMQKSIDEIRKDIDFMSTLF